MALQHPSSNPSPRVYSIPPGADFLGTLGEAILDGTLIPGFSRAAGPLGLAAATIYLPTRRAARALAAVFADRLGGEAALLPRIVPLGALDDTELLFGETGIDADPDGDLPPAIGDIARRMILTRLILAWGESVRHAIVSVDAAGRRALRTDEALLVATAPADAWHLSGELGNLIDELAIEDVAWSQMAPLGSEAFDRYWRITLDFLDIAIARYPLILAERGEVDGSTRQIRLIEAEVARLGAGRGRGPVVVAGSTGSNAATARLMAAVARLDQGAVVLPGLDRTLDDRAWAMIGASPGAAGDAAAGHPQAALKNLIGVIGIRREAVRVLGSPPPERLARERLVGEALRPAESTDLWRNLDLDRKAALGALTLIEAADEREEALAIAVVLREMLEGPGTAALVTPDRTLARRVREELMRWSIDIEDSSGEPLGQTSAGALARHVTDCALEDLAPAAILALLQHPQLRLGRPRHAVLRLARRLEAAVLRGVIPPAALQAPAALLAHARARADTRHAPAEPLRLQDGDFAELAKFLDDLIGALAPLRALPRTAALPDWLAAHEAVLAALARDETGSVAATGADFGALAELFEDLDAAADPAIVLDCPGYAAFFARLLAEIPVRGPNRSHPRLKILGLLEARLLSVDRIILGGLDETVWPPAARADPFLNRPMRAALGLSPPERRIGRTAHDFEMALGQAEICITRAAKRDGAPTVPSRFLQRMAAVAGEAFEACRARGRVTLALARALDRPARFVSLKRPAPRPKVALRPQRLSVTRIETLRRDPYSIYAESILQLTPWDALGLPMGAREFGTAFHDAMGGFAADLPPGPLPADALAQLRARLEQSFALAFADPEFRAFHWPRILRWAKAYLGWEASRREGLETLLIETRGRLPLSLADGSTFTLSAIADRIEQRRSGLVLIDFKTGASPSLREVRVGFAPQLTLEAAMVARNAFAGVDAARPVEAALYVKFGNSEEVKTVALDWKGDPPLGSVVAEHAEEVLGLLNGFRDAATGYMARPFPKYALRFGAYDHLARVREWSATGGLDAGAEAEA